MSTWFFCMLTYTYDCVESLVSSYTNEGISKVYIVNWNSCPFSLHNIGTLLNTGPSFIIEPYSFKSAIAVLLGFCFDKTNDFKIEIVFLLKNKKYK